MSKETLYNPLFPSKNAKGVETASKVTALREGEGSIVRSSINGIPVLLDVEKHLAEPIPE